MMNRLYCFVVIVIFQLLATLPMVASDTFNVLFIHSYNAQTPHNIDLCVGLSEGFAKVGMKVDIRTRYLDAEFWSYDLEKVIMKRICQRAKEFKTDLIVTVGDEAFFSLMNCGDSLPFRIPIVFFGIKYPDENLIHLPNVCGLTNKPDFYKLLKEANKLFPDRKEVVCLTDNSYLSQKGKSILLKEWERFIKEYPGYNILSYNTQRENTNKIIASICYPKNSFERIVIAPKWSSFLTFIGKNSKAPFFACQNVALTNGVICLYDVDARSSARQAGEMAAKVLKGTLPSKIGVAEAKQQLYFDYKQLDYFHIQKKKVRTDGVVLNEPYWEKYKWFFIFGYSSAMVLLLSVVVWLVKVNRRESRRRIHAQTRLLVQNKLVEQRNEFDDIFHSIHDGLVTYDTNFYIHFTNRTLLDMLHLSSKGCSRPYEGAPASSIFQIYNNGEEVLLKLLQQVASTDQIVLIPEGSFMKEVHTGNYFPVSGEIVPIRKNGQITGMALSARNISEQDMQKRFFDMAVEESSIYPWKFDMDSKSFIFQQGFLSNFGFDPEVTLISRLEMDAIIHPDDLVEIRPIFEKALTGENEGTRLSFRLKNYQGEYEWWEFRISVLKGLTTRELYSIFGIAQSIQRYKTTEMELMEARDKALQADRLKSAFLANMSHEIRTPLNAIVGFSDLLSDTSSFSDEEVAQFIDTINKNCGLLLALINDILDLSRIESGTMDFQESRHSLSLLLRNIYDSQRLNMPKNVELRLRVPSVEKIYIMTDSIRLQQVINNLINNAAKFTTEGSITFGYEEDADPKFIKIFVEDTGVGISEEGVKHIFERFYKINSFTQGAGLGLSICLTIVEHLNGSITVKSQLGKGTRFTVRIPGVCS